MGLLGNKPEFYFSKFVEVETENELLKSFIKQVAESQPPVEKWSAKAKKVLESIKKDLPNP